MQNKLTILKEKDLAAIVETAKTDKFQPHQNEGMIYIKMVALKPSTVNTGDPVQVISDAPGAILLGSLSEIKTQFFEWYDQLVSDYQKHNI